jgi:hypothetical protein
MPVYSKNQKHILFIHIPKTGGSTLEKIFISKGWEEYFYLRGKNLDQLKFFKSSPQHFNSKLINEIFNIEEFNKIVTIVRNPFDRLKSEFYWQLKQNLILNKNIKPEEWFNQILLNYEKNPYIYDNHIRPQNEFLIDKAKIFKLEEGLNKVCEYIFEESSFKMPRISRNPIKFFKETKLKETKKKQSIEEEFLKIKFKIEDFYYKDYQLFKY